MIQIRLPFFMDLIKDLIKLRSWFIKFMVIMVIELIIILIVFIILQLFGLIQFLLKF